MFLDVPDALVRRVLGRGHWPPYSLRAFVGGAQRFDDAGNWFLEDLLRLRLLDHGTRVLEIGCGCGRIARPLATDGRPRGLRICYAGMDVDPACVSWCQRNITPLNDLFAFYHADCYNPSYNSRGAGSADSYLFPHPASSFDLILLTSVFTHLLEGELRHYLAEVSRLLAPGGVAYATFFLYGSLSDAVAGAERHRLRFPFARGHHAVNREDYPTNAVAYEEGFVRRVASSFGLSVLEPARYGVQDILLSTKVPEASQAPELIQGWHAVECSRWRWTERVFSVRLVRPMSERMTLRFRFVIPPVVIQANGPVRLWATAEGAGLAACEYSTPGEHLYTQEFSTSSRAAKISIRFELDKAYRPLGAVNK